MARKSKTQELQDIHYEAVTEFDEVYAASEDERMQALEDRRFYSIAGAQWEGDAGDQFANRPRFEFNKIHLSVMRGINEYRNNRITVDFQPRDGTPDDKLADTCDGLWRQMERHSGAEEAYDNAYEEQISGGMGAWRLKAEYENDEDEEDERQHVCVEPIHDAESTVFFNLDAKRQDKADAKRCWVLTPYSKKSAKEEWDEDPSTWERGVTQSNFDWATADVVWIAEYYRVEEYKERVSVFKGVDGSEVTFTQDELDEDPNLRGELDATGFRFVKEKRLEKRRVHKYIMSGNRILQDCGYIPGRYIPIIVTYGKRWVVDGIERFMGHVRLAKDAIRLQNMLMSWLADIAGRFDVEKPIFAPEQVKKWDDMWTNDNVRRYAYLLADPIKGADGAVIQNGPVAYTKAPSVPPAMAALAQLAEAALQDLMGNQQQGDEIQPNLSGKAVELIQNRLDKQTFIYMSNFARAMKHSGKVWLSMMKDIVVETNRRMRTLGPDGKTSSVVMNTPAFDPETGKEYLQNDLSKASFDVDADVGPTSGSQRAATVRALTGLMSITSDEETKAALTLATITNIEGEGLSDLRDWARKRSLKMGIVKPTEDEQKKLAEEMQNTPPSPQDQYLAAAAEQARADAAKKRADTVESVSSAELNRAKAAETMQKVQQAPQEMRIATAEALQRMLRDAVPKGIG